MAIQYLKDGCSDIMKHRYAKPLLVGAVILALIILIPLIINKQGVIAQFFKDTIERPHLYTMRAVISCVVLAVLFVGLLFVIRKIFERTLLKK